MANPQPGLWPSSTAARNARDACRSLASSDRGRSSCPRDQPLRAANPEPAATRNASCYRQENKQNPTAKQSRHRNAERRRRRGDRRLEDRRRGEGTRGWMLTCCGGGAGWSGGSESDEIRWRRRGVGWDGNKFRLRGGGLVSSQIRPGRSARRAGPRAGPFIAPVGSGHGRSGGPPPSDRIWSDPAAEGSDAV